MPMVGKKKFPYSEKGEKEAKEYGKKKGVPVTVMIAVGKPNCKQLKCSINRFWRIYHDDSCILLFRTLPFSNWHKSNSKHNNFTHDA